ncbi:MAG: pentapeptide repeat-containing protein [Pseudomonadota bacterium]
MAGVVGGVFGLYQLHNSATRTRLTRIDTRTKRESERNERFVRAAELLKDEDASVRMAGIYALERLALETDAKYSQTVIKVLSGFVRERTTRRGNAPTQSKPIYKTNETLEKYRSRFNAWLSEQEAPTEPITAAVRALGVIWREENDRESENIKKRVFDPKYDGRLTVITFEKAILTKLEATNIDLNECNFHFAALEGAKLSHAGLEKAYLEEAHLERADLEYANLNDARLWNVNLQDAYLSAADLENAYLVEARLQGANLTRAHLRKAKLGLAKMQGAILAHANLEGASLTHARLEGANLESANLTNVRNLTKEQLEAAVWPIGAPPTLPEGFNAADFDKEPYTNQNNPERLKPRHEWPE